MFNVMVSVFIMVGMGMALPRLGILKREQAKSLNTLVVNLAMPALVFNSMRQAELSASLLKIPLVGVICSLLCFGLSYLICRFLKAKSEDTGSVMLASSLGNTSFLGFPLIISIFGSSSLVYGVFYDQLATGAIAFTLGAMLAANFGKGEQGKNPLFEFLRFPAIWAMFAGLLLNGVVLPEFVLNTLQYLGNMLVPLVMLNLGLNLQPKSIGRSWNLVGAAVIIKLFIFPALYYVLVTSGIISFDNLPTEAFPVAMMEAGMPSMMTTLVLAIRYDLNAQLVAEIILVTLVLSAVTVPLLLSLI